MDDMFNSNWRKFANSVKGKFYSKKNKDRLNNYECYYIEFSLKTFLVQIEIYIQLMPARESYSTFLERYTKIILMSNQERLKEFQLTHKQFFSFLFKKTRSSTVSKKFDKEYQIHSSPSNLAFEFFDKEILDFLVDKKLIEGQLQFKVDKAQNELEFKFPEILYSLKDIELMKRMCVQIVELLS